MNVPRLIDARPELMHVCNLQDVRDIWARKGLGQFKGSMPLRVAAWDSVFLRVTPHAE